MLFRWRSNLRRTVLILCCVGCFYGLLRLFNSAWIHLTMCLLSSEHEPWKPMDDLLDMGLKSSYDRDKIIHRTLGLVDRGPFINLTAKPGDFQKYYPVEPTEHVSTTCAVSPKTLFIFVQSKTTNFALRNAIRKSWAIRSHYEKGELCVIFVLGKTPNSSSDLEKSIENEVKQNGDILLLNIHDTYDNLTLKGLLAMTWIASQRVPINYIFKTDDDIMLNTFSWLRVRDKLWSMNLTCCLVSIVWYSPKILRYGKWVITEEEYAFGRIPSFCTGSGYLMTRQAMISILKGAYRLPFLRRDDPFFTGIVRHQMNIPVWTVPQNSYIFHYSNTPRSFSDPIMVFHQPTEEEWKKTWQRIKHNHFIKNIMSSLSMRRLFERQFRLPHDWRLDTRLSCPTPSCGVPKGLENHDLLYVDL